MTIGSKYYLLHVCCHFVPGREEGGRRLLLA